MGGKLIARNASIAVGSARKGDTTRLLAEYLAGDSYTDIARRHRMTRQNVQKRIARLVAILEVRPAELKAYRKHEAAILDAARLRMVETATQRDKLAASSTQQLITSAGVLFDRSRLLRGESTSNISARVEAVMTAHDRDRTPQTEDED